MKINKILTCSLLGFFLVTTSCSRYLDTEPLEAQISTGDIPIESADAAENMMNTIYNNFGNEYWQLDYFFNGDAQTDISYAGADNVQNFQIDEYRILSTNNNINRDWVYLNNFIYNSNMILNYVDDVSGITDSRKKEMKSEAAIFRALYMFHMAQYWGDSPIVTKAVISVNSENFDEVYSQVYPSRKPILEVYDQIISDLENAIPNAPSSSQKYRANKGAAYTLLAKVYATKPNPDWTKVKQYCNSAIAEGYSLLPVYDNLFDGAHEGNAEAIWEVNGNAAGIWAWGTSMFLGTDWKKFNIPSNDLYKTFNDAGDAKRLNSSIKFETVTWGDNFWQSNHYPFMYKMRKTDGTQNFYIFRYADLLLTKAEADIKTGDFAGATTLINQVRSRVGLSPITISSTDDGINKLLIERKLELAFEGHRWFDLKRTGKAISILSQQKNGNGTTLSYATNINQNKLLWPIPQTQIDKNQNLTQNPGY